MFQQHILNSSRVCTNCLKRKKRERQRGARAWEDLFSDHTYLENEPHTTAEYVPDEPVTNARHRFCSCGAHGSYTRIWDDDDIALDRFRDLVKHAIETLDAEGFDVNRSRVAYRAIQAFYTRRRHGPYREGRAPDRPDSINDCLAAGVDAGVTDPDPEPAPEAADAIRA